MAIFNSLTKNKFSGLLQTYKVGKTLQVVGKTLQVSIDQKVRSALEHSAL